VRKRYLVAYDVRNPERLRTMRRVMLGFGEPLQYSVFVCELSEKEKALMIGALTEIIHQAEDRVLIADLGIAGGTGDLRIEFLGQMEELPERRPVVI